MKKGYGESPRMLPYVVQAVTDLKDMNGSTMRKILDQVHTAINITNVKPKPRNVVMQIKRALKHAVDSGVLRHKAGKYRLILDTKPIKKNNGLKIRTRRAVSRRRRRRQRKGRKSKQIRRRGKNIGLKRSSISPISAGSTSSTCDQSLARDSYEKKSRNKRRRRRSLAKKTVHFRRSGKKTKNKGRPRRLRQPTPMPTEGRMHREPEPDTEAKNMKIDEGEESPELANEINNLENIFANKCLNQNQVDVDQSAETEVPRTVESPPIECDNPECLCNLKQEPSEDGNYENCNDREFYQ